MNTSPLVWVREDTVLNCNSITSITAAAPIIGGDPDTAALWEIDTTAGRTIVVTQQQAQNLLIHLGMVATQQDLEEMTDAIVENKFKENLN